MSRLLIVEDEFDLLATMKAIFEGEGHEVVGVSDGRDALKALERASFDLLLLDVMLPGMNGLGVLERVRATEATRTLPVVLMSHSRPHVREEDYRWSAFLQKPFSLDSLLAVVSSQIGARGPAGV